MRPNRGRTKKLIVAFHFQFSDPAGWKCDVCRANGLEEKRRCGWLSEGPKTPERVVWARERISTTTCPKSLISAESLAWIERYYAWRLSGRGDVRKLSAKEVDAFCILENELLAERE